MSNLQPTGILARVSFYHEQGARLEVVSQRSRMNELGVPPEKFDNSTFFEVGTKLELSGDKYEIIKIDFVFMPRLNSSTIPEINPETYLTDTNEQLPNNMFVHVTVRPL